ncbi:Fe2+-dependent dioxygenase [Hydrogenophaga sp. IBVHS2]|uniref:Fe2+-dependent dioxygenase n=1 Tax=Hydrogenophaga sp. IBVHS2 TaxID=1985170 RepID=UPI000A2E5EC4|nr:Fe2+-dependent dioxygenase [Hydrogenophaga sp. IBVHS2]OSZ67842.1 Fe2+-dependent dioxygenase [Hydrogenophaga sp. IBVHS2]
MLLPLKDLLTPEEVRQARARLGAQAPWVDGAGTAGGQAAALKHNRQLQQDSDASRGLQALVAQALERDPLFISAALPRQVLPALFNRYRAPADGGQTMGDHYGRHVDNAVLRLPGTGTAQWMRGDLSCTVFLSDPDSYDGGELVVHHSTGTRAFKLPAGHALLYPASTVHEVTPVTRGERLAGFFWVQSLVADESRRQILFDLDMNLLRLRARHGDSAETTALSGVYHNLLRQWSQL